MPYLWLPVGLLLPTLSGWFLLRLLEGTSPVLSRYERIIAGLFLGGTFLMYVTFLAHVVGLIGFTKIGFLSVQAVTAFVLGAAYWKYIGRTASPVATTVQRSAMSTKQAAALLVFCIWIAIKLGSAIVLTAGPAYFDDTVNNWNMRAKSYVEAHALVLEIEPGKGVGVGSYPPTVPMLKAWFTLLNGEWNEGLANSLHVVWYACALALLYFSVRRIAGNAWGLVAAYVLSSLPLFTMHGAAAYGDLFLSLHVFLAMSFLMHAARSAPRERAAFIRLGALAAALLVFTKNEALLLHLPPFCVALLCVLWILRARNTLTTQEMLQTALWYGISVAAVLLPWLVFKWSHHLEFGNAKGIGGLEIAWHPGVLKSIWVNTFLEGNWSLLPGILLALIALRFRDVTRTYLGIVTAFLGMVILGQLPIYALTPLATEALNQTGYARGLIHLAPVTVLLAVLLARNFMRSVRD